MATLVWDSKHANKYETGVSNGVLYPKDGPGVVWNGLISVDALYEGGAVSSYYYDGVKYLETVSPKDFKAKIQAFTFPKAFGPYFGQAEIRKGIYLTNQPRDRFGLSYKTNVGEKDYKIHLIYNATAKLAKRDISTISNRFAPNDLEWDIFAVPVKQDGLVPTAHYVLDSTKVDPEKLQIIEDILYGFMHIHDPFDGNELWCLQDGNFQEEIVDGNDPSPYIHMAEPRLLLPNEILGILFMHGGQNV